MFPPKELGLPFPDSGAFEVAFEAGSSQVQGQVDGKKDSAFAVFCRKRTWVRMLLLPTHSHNTGVVKLFPLFLQFL